MARIGRECFLSKKWISKKNMCTAITVACVGYIINKDGFPLGDTFWNLLLAFAIIAAVALDMRLIVFGLA